MDQHVGPRATVVLLAMWAAGCAAGVRDDGRRSEAVRVGSPELRIILVDRDAPTEHEYLCETFELHLTRFGRLADAHGWEVPRLMIGASSDLLVIERDGTVRVRDFEGRWVTPGQLVVVRLRSPAGARPVIEVSAETMASVAIPASYGKAVLAREYRYAVRRSRDDEYSLVPVPSEDP